MNGLAIALVDAPWGPVHLAATARAVVAAAHLAATTDFLAGLAGRAGRGQAEGEAGAPGRPPSRAAVRLVDEAAEQLAAYLAGRRRTFDVPIDLGPRPAWDRAVLAGVAAVPWGAVTSYGRVARRIGRPGAARAVGGAVGRNPVAILVPCHRVVNGDGSIGGFGGERTGSRGAMLEVKRELLRLEGVTLPPGTLFD